MGNCCSEVLSEEVNNTVNEVVLSWKNKVDVCQWKNQAFS